MGVQLTLSKDPAYPTQPTWAQLDTPLGAASSPWLCRVMYLVTLMLDNVGDPQMTPSRPSWLIFRKQVSGSFW